MQSKNKDGVLEGTPFLIRESAKLNITAYYYLLLLLLPCEKFDDKDQNENHAKFLNIFNSVVPDSQLERELAQNSSISSISQALPFPILND